MPAHASDYGDLSANQRKALQLPIDDLARRTNLTEQAKADLIETRLAGYRERNAEREERRWAERRARAMSREPSSDALRHAQFLGRSGGGTASRRPSPSPSLRSRSRRRGSSCRARAAGWDPAGERVAVSEPADPADPASSTGVTKRRVHTPPARIGRIATN